MNICGERLAEVEARIDGLLGRMTLDQKVAELHGSARVGDTYVAGGDDALGIPPFRMVDGARGVHQDQATAFPVGIARGATWDPELERRVGEAIGAEARAKGANVLLAPTLNVVRHPRWGRAQETYGEDPLGIGVMGAAFVRGAQEHVIATAKHFALNSIEDTRFTVDVTADERALREIYLPHFKRAVDAGVGAIMTGYNKANGAYCSENTHLLRDVLRGDWGYQGFVMSDWLLGTRSTGPALEAGLDVEMPSGKFFGPLTEAVRGGDVPVELVDRAVRRVLRAKLCFRLDQAVRTDPSVVASRAHTDLALEVAQKSIVLLKNENKTLPLDRAALPSLVVLGRLADEKNIGDKGSSSVTPPYVVSALAGLRDRAPGVTVTHIASDPLSAADREAVLAATAVVVVAGLGEKDEGEGLIAAGDRVSLALPGTQDALIEAVAGLNPRTVVVLEGSGPVLVDRWVGAVPAILAAWYPGMEGGHAIADVLLGDVNPSGKLPMTFPRREADLPPFDNVSRGVRYDLFHGYRHLDRTGTAAQFPFGHGQSYTTFAYSAVEIVPGASRLEIGVDVRNSGSRPGDEIVQVYASYEGSAIERPVHELKGFARVALAVGETKRVKVPIEIDDLAFHDPGSAAWRVERLTYTFHVGSSSSDLPLSARWTPP